MKRSTLKLINLLCLVLAVGAVVLALKLPLVGGAGELRAVCIGIAVFTGIIGIMTFKEAWRK